MGDRPAGTFGELLLRYRKAAGLRQEELAERAGLSARAISDLERGVKHTPRKDTLLLLADALRLSPQERVTFTGTARGALATPTAPPLPMPDDYPAATAAAPAPQPPRHNLPAPVTPLLGREAELAALTALLADADVRLVGRGGEQGGAQAGEAALDFGFDLPKGGGGMLGAPIGQARDNLGGERRQVGGGGVSHGEPPLG